jgi:hypothetical protein
MSGSPPCTSCLIVLAAKVLVAMWARSWGSRKMLEWKGGFGLSSALGRLDSMVVVVVRRRCGLPLLPAVVAEAGDWPYS